MDNAAGVFSMYPWGLVFDTETLVEVGDRLCSGGISWLLICVVIGRCSSDRGKTEDTRDIFGTYLRRRDRVQRRCR